MRAVRGKYVQCGAGEDLQAGVEIGSLVRRTLLQLDASSLPT
jgi:hypothetical protein